VCLAINYYINFHQIPLEEHIFVLVFHDDEAGILIFTSFLCLTPGFLRDHFNFVANRPKLTPLPTATSVYICYNHTRFFYFAKQSLFTLCSQIRVLRVCRIRFLANKRKFSGTIFNVPCWKIIHS